MALFRYRAVDQYGEPLEGTMDESTAARVTATLQEQGAQVNSVERLTNKPSIFKTDRALSWSDVALVNDQLLAITRSGAPLEPAIGALAQDMHSRRVRQALTDIEASLSNGKSLGEAIDSQPNTFPSIYLSMVRAGERTGNLQGVLELLNRHTTRILDLRSHLIAQSAYPMMVMITAAFVVSFLLVRVVPIFKEIYQGFGSGLPASTQLLVNVSDTLTALLGSWLIFAVPVGVLILIGLAFAFNRSPRGRALIYRGFLFVPYVGRVLRLTSLSRFSSSLGLLLSSDVPVQESLDLAAAASGNVTLRQRVRSALPSILSGSRVAEALKATTYFPQGFCWLIANAEDRGDLPTTLIELGESYNREVSEQDREFLALLAPIVVVTLGFGIGFIVLSLYLPIFSLGDAITR